MSGVSGRRCWGVGGVDGKGIWMGWYSAADIMYLIGSVCTLSIGTQGVVRRGRLGGQDSWGLPVRGCQPNRLGRGARHRGEERRMPGHGREWWVSPRMRCQEDDNVEPAVSRLRSYLSVRDRLSSSNADSTWSGRKLQTRDHRGAGSVDTVRASIARYMAE